MKILDKLRHWTIDSIKFKLILPVVVLQIFSTNIGQLVNFVFDKGREVIADAGMNTNYMDGNIGFFVSSGLSILISAFILIFLYDRLVLRRLLKVVAFTEKLGDGDLSVTLNFKGNDDISRLGSSLVKSSSNIRNLVMEIDRTFNNMHATSGLLLHSTQNSADSIQSIHATASFLAEDALHLIQEAQTVNESIAEINHTNELLIQKMESSLSASAAMKKRADRMEKEGIQSLERSQMTYTDKHKNLLKAIEAGKVIDEINTLASSVRDISEQTNLLALNASIEAARAGENGKGFEVVAGEVRKLAGQSAAAIADVDRLVAQVRDAFGYLAESSQDILNYINQDVQADYELLIETGRQYQQDAQLVTAMSEEMNAATTAMSGSVMQISSVIDKVVQRSAKTSDYTNQIKDRLGEFNIVIQDASRFTEDQTAMSNQLSNSIQKFRL